MLEEWILYNNTHDTNHSPWAIFKNDYHDFDYYLKNLEQKEGSAIYVPDSTFFCYDEDRDIMVGAVPIELEKKYHVQIRSHSYNKFIHQLTESYRYEKHILYPESKFFVHKRIPS